MKPEELRQIRKEYKLSQHRLAKLTDLSRYRISMFEAGYASLWPEEISIIREVIRDIDKQLEFPKEDLNVR